MLVLLLFCFCCANFAQTLEDSEYFTVSAEGNSFMSCHQSSKIIPLKVKVLVEEGDRHCRVWLELKSILEELDTTQPSLSLTRQVTRDQSQNYSCSVYNNIMLEPQDWDAESDKVTFDPGKPKSMVCNTSDEWKTLAWFSQGGLIAAVSRDDPNINIRVERGSSSIAITSIILPNPREKTALFSCKAATGWQKFTEDKYWIIVASALGYVLFCLTLTCSYMAIRRRRKAEKERKAKARFFKVSTARNLYTESTNQEPATLKHDGMYQNFSVTKGIGCDDVSNKSSFLDPSEEGDSYLEPMSPEEADQISDDGDCYENANEEIKEGSIGSLSYEDMNGPKNGHALAPEKTCEEDADSYENMQTPIYSQLNRSVNSLGHSMEDGVGQDGSNMAHVSVELEWPNSTELKKQNGDFYLSYQATNF